MGVVIALLGVVHLVAGSAGAQLRWVLGVVAVLFVVCVPVLGGDRQPRGTISRHGRRAAATLFTAPR